MTTELTDTKQIELHFEAANDGGNMAERGAVMAVTGAIKAGIELQLAKEAIGHGNWLAELRKNWNYSQDVAIRYMRIAANSARVPNLKDAKSVREALRMIADDKTEKDPDQPIVPRSERKPADVKVSIPDDSTRVLDDDGEPDADEVDDDPTPDPPTIRKTAKGSEKVPEAKKPKTAAIVPEIVDEPTEEVDPFGPYTFAELLIVLQEKIPDDAAAHKHAAKLLRKAADKLDPPSEDNIPTRIALENAIPETWSEPLRTAAKDWAGYKQARKKDDRIQSLRAWQIALNQMTDQPEAIVIQKINNAIANSYKGWNHDSGTGKTQNNGHSNGKADGSCLGANGRPEVQKRKIIYK